MKKHRIVSILILVLITALTIPVLAASTTREATLTYRDIQILVDGKAVTPTDANGNTVEPFILDGTTYVPLRAISDMLGVEVQWDGETNTITLGSAPQTITALEDLVFDTQHTIQSLNYKVPAGWTANSATDLQEYYALDLYDRTGGYIRCSVEEPDSTITTKSKAQTYYNDIVKELDSSRTITDLKKSDVTAFGDRWYGEVSYKLTLDGVAERVKIGIIFGKNAIYQLAFYAPAGDEAGLNTAFEKFIDTAAFVNTNTDVFILSAGTYKVGDDIKSGKYDCTAVSGFGNFVGTVKNLGGAGLNEIMGAPGTIFSDNQTYSNLRLVNGDEITIMGDLEIKFTKK